jgi:hypothetical protein
MLLLRVLPDWTALLDSLSITKQRHLRMATEGALLGSVLKHGLCHDLVIVSDDAGQFNILLHALCWIHTERLIHKMLPLNETHIVRRLPESESKSGVYMQTLNAIKEMPIKHNKKYSSNASMRYLPRKPATPH